MNSQELSNLQEAYREVVENQQLNEAEGSYGQTPTARKAYGDLANKRRETPASGFSKRGEKTQKVKSAQKHFDRTGNPDAGNRGKKSTKPSFHSGKRQGMTQSDRDDSRGEAEYGHTGYDPSFDGPPSAPGSKPKGKKLERQRKTGVSAESYDIYDIILSHLLDEGYAETPEAAEVIMVNMSEDWRDDIVEATAMAKRGYDEAPIRKKIAANTGGGESADRATKLASRPTYGNSNVKGQREKLARTQRRDFRDTTSSNPGLHGYAYKSDDSAVRAKQSARGAQRGVLTPNEKSALNR
jgi:hypothetical protein